MVGWDGVAAAYDAGFGRLCAGAASHLLDGVLDDHAARLLDVGCGSGSLAAAATARQIAVHGCDASETMISFAARRVRAGAFVAAALPHLPYRDATFDAVTAGFVINHVADPLAAVREIARITRTGGRAALTIWPAGTTALNQLWQDVITDAGVVPQPSPRLDADHEFHRTEAGLADLVTRADLELVEVRTVSWTFRIRPAALWAGVEAGIAGIGATFLAQPEEQRDRMRAAFAGRVGRHGNDGELALPVSALVVVATPSPVRGSVGPAV